MAALVWFGGLMADRAMLNDHIIRLHVVANSDSEEDQELKLQVKDAVVSQLNGIMESLPDAKEAKQWIQQNVGELETYVNELIAQAGSTAKATVSLAKEAFETREYETFSLPAGWYEALRITIGEGEGKNWWCVVFPTLCEPATTQEFSDTAVGSGFPQSLTASLQNNGEYKIRFFLLDCLGRIENFIKSF